MVCVSIHLVRSPTQSALAKLTAALAYGLASLLIMFVNKFTLTVFSFPSFTFLALAQCIASEFWTGWRPPARGDDRLSLTPQRTHHSTHPSLDMDAMPSLDLRTSPHSRGDHLVHEGRGGHQLPGL